MSNDMIPTSNYRVPDVTVLMPVFNAEKYLREAIDSILAQTFRYFELLIINDGSTDGSSDILASYSDPRIVIVDNEQNIGLANSLNKGLALARGELVARMDADDISFPDRLMKQVCFMRRNPSVAVLGTQVAFINADGRKIKVFACRQPISPLATKYALMFGAPVSHPSVVFRKELIVNKFGGYNQAYKVSEDTELWCRVGKEHLIQNLPDVLLTMRLHSMSVSYDAFHPRRVGHIDIWIKRLPEVREEILGENAIPCDWGKWWVLVFNFHCFIGKKASIELLNGIDRIQKLFIEKYKEASRDVDIPKLTASYKAQVALHLVENDRLGSFGAFSQVFKTDREIAFLYMPKFVGILLLGNTAKKIFRTLSKFVAKIS